MVWRGVGQEEDGLDEHVRGPGAESGTGQGKAGLRLRIGGDVAVAMKGSRCKWMV